MLAVALVGSGVFVDPAAQSSFAAPQRLAVVLGAGLGAIALVWSGARFELAAWSKDARGIAALAGVLGLWLLLATICASHPASAWASLRTIALFALLLALGASAALDGGGRRLAFVAAGVVALNAAISLLQAGGLTLPLSVARLGGRLPTAALLGNEGYVALACALLGAASGAVLANVTVARMRWLALATLLLCVVTIAVNRQATAAIALVAALGLIAAVCLRQRWCIGVVATLVGVIALTAGIAPLRAVTWGAVADLPAYQQLTTHRVSAWATALHIARRHPVTGIGPGGFAADSQRHRFDAEIALHTRLPPPSTANTFAQAHNEGLQLGAEAGWPALLLALAALGWLMLRLLNLARAPGAVEPLLLAAVLGAGGVAALAWFPLQVPLTATILLLVCGRAWRLVARSQPVPT